MAHMWDRGVLSASSWHGLEEIGVFTDARSMVEHGYDSGAWPVEVFLTASEARLPDGTLVTSDEEKSVIATYKQHKPRIVGVNGNRYHFNTPKAWAELCEAAEQAGGKPTGAFSLCGGRKILATFEVNGRDNGIATNLMIADSFDGTQKLTVGFTSVRVVCANTLAMALKGDGQGMAMLKHNSTLNQKVEGLKLAIETALESGKSVRDMFELASTVNVSNELIAKAFDSLFPEASEDSSDHAKTRAENNRDEGRIAMSLGINLIGSGNNLASLWNAATWLVDRENDGSPRVRQNSDPLESLLFGQRGKRIAQIQTVIQDTLAMAA